ncbi:MAG: hypothetical protein ACAI38_05045 [Myxococcota bacterium]|nr:hypothetical protein [Myxococcota bacterium]
MQTKLSGPLDLVHARGLAAVVSDLEANKVPWATITVRVNTGNGGTKPIAIEDPAGVAREAQAKFKDLIEDAVRTAVQREQKPSVGWRIAGAVGSAAKEAALSAGDWVADRTPPRVREGVVVTGILAKEGFLAAGRLVQSGIHAATEAASRYQTGRDLIRRVDNAEMVATRVIVEVVDRDGGSRCYAPWVIDPISTLRNEQTQAAINGAMTVVGWGPVGPVAAAAFAAGFTIWGALTDNEAESRARSNMGLSQLMQAVASVVPFAAVYTLPTATARDIAEAKAVSEGMKNGDPFVTFWPGWVIDNPEAAPRQEAKDEEPKGAVAK